MQEIKLNEKGEVVLYTDNGRMENGKITSEIKGNFNCDELTAASLYLKGKGLSIKTEIPTICSPRFERQFEILTDDIQLKEAIEFNIPKGYVYDEENSTDEKVIYKLEEKPIAKNWEEVCEVMFPINNKVLYTTSTGEISSFEAKAGTFDKNNVTSKQQCEKLMAINQLMTVAKYLNDLDCFENDYKLMGIYIMPVEGLRISSSNSAIVSFKGKERASQAIKILGEDVIKLALTPNNY